MENIEVVRLLLGEQRGHERVDHGLCHAVANREQKHAPEQALERQGLPPRGEGGGRGQCESGRDHVHQEGGEHQGPKADPVGDQARQQDDDAKAGQATAGDRAEFGLGEPVLLGPLPEDAGSNREAHARSKDRHEPGPEQPLGVGDGAGNGVARLTGVTVLCHRGMPRWWWTRRPVRPSMAAWKTPEIRWNHGTIASRAGW